MRTLWARRDGESRLAPVQDVDGREWVAHALPLAAKREAGATLTLLMAAPREELQAFQIESRRHSFYISLGLMLLLLPLVHLLADRVSRPLRELARQAEAIRHFEFDGPDAKRSLIREVDRLALAMTAMKHSLRRFLDISGALSAERDFDTLLDLILRETIAVAEASGGAVHLLSEDGTQLQPAATRVQGETAPRKGLTWDLKTPDGIAAPVQALRANAPVEIDLNWDNPAHLKAYQRLFTGLNASRLRLLSLPLKEPPGRDHRHADAELRDAGARASRGAGRGTRVLRAGAVGHGGAGHRQPPAAARAQGAAGKLHPARGGRHRCQEPLHRRPLPARARAGPHAGPGRLRRDRGALCRLHDGPR